MLFLHGAVPNPDPGPYRGCTEASRLLLGAFWEAFGEPPDASAGFWGPFNCSGSLLGALWELSGSSLGASGSFWELSGSFLGASGSFHPVYSLGFKP